MAIREVTGHEFDFRVPRNFGTTEIDHSFTDIRFDGGTCVRLTGLDPAGTGAGMSWDISCAWLQVHTTDKKPPLPHRIGLAVVGPNPR